MSWPAACASGPSWPQPVIRPKTSLGLRANAISGPSPRRSITPGRKPSISASALARRSSTWAMAALSFRSSSTTLRPRPATDFRFFLAPTRSSVTTSAPISASIMQANGPGPMPANSTMRKPVRGPEALTWDCAADLSSTVVFQSMRLSRGRLAAMAAWIAERDLRGVRPELSVLLLPLRAGAVLGDLAAERNVDRDVLVAHRFHGLFARQGLLDIRREFFLFLLLALDFARLELRHHLVGEQCQRLADVLVLVVAALLDEHGLIDAGFLEMPQMRPQLIGCADAVIGAGRRQSVARFFEIGPDVGAAGLVLAENIMMREPIAEEAQAVLAAAARFFLVRMQREAGHHRHVRIDGVADRHAFLLEDAIVIIDPLPRLARIDKGKGQRTDAAARRQLDRFAVGAGDPERRMWFLQRLRHHIAAGHLEELAREAGIGVHHQHVDALLDALFPHSPLLDRIEADIETAELHQRGALAGAEFDAAVGNQIEGCDALGDAGRVIVFRRHQADAMAEPDLPGALRAGGEKDLGRRGVRIFLEKMVLDFPGIVDAEPVGELDLVERFLQQAVLGPLGPWPRQLMLIENAEFHGRSGWLF